MYAVPDNRTPQVVVLPVGGSKSLLFIVPGSIDSTGVTAVVVLYRALIKDLVARIQGCRINCIEWKYSKSNPAAVAIISVDLAGDVRSDSNLLIGKELLR
jgi:superfamily II DNA helicase RecQ